MWNIVSIKVPRNIQNLKPIKFLNLKPIKFLKPIKLFKRIDDDKAQGKTTIKYTIISK